MNTNYESKKFEDFCVKLTKSCSQSYKITTLHAPQVLNKEKFISKYSFGWIRMSVLIFLSQRIFFALVITSWCNQSWCFLSLFVFSRWTKIYHSSHKQLNTVWKSVLIQQPINYLVQSKSTREWHRKIIHSLLCHSHSHRFYVKIK